MTWRRGSQVVVRSRPGDGVGYTFPAIVMRDVRGTIALFQPLGTVCKRRGGRRGGPAGRSLVSWDGTYEDIMFERATIHVHVPGDPFWLVRRWTGTDHVGWYINLASPWQRTRIGFDTLDHILDIEFADDRSFWSWKDEGELEWAVQQGRLSTEGANAIRRHGMEALACMEEHAPPFVDDWSDLKPDPGWPIPVLPAGWDRV